VGLCEGPGSHQPLIQGFGATPVEAFSNAVAAGRAEATRLLLWAATVEAKLPAPDMAPGQPASEEASHATE